MNDKLHRPMHEEDPFLPAEEQDLFLPAEEQDLFLPAEEQDLPSPVQEESSPEPVSRPPKAKGRLSHSPKASGSGAVQATGSRQPTSTPQPTSTRLSQLATPTPKLRATAGPTSLTAGALILLNPGVVRQGSQVSVTGTGFTPKATIDLVLKRQAQDLSLSATVVQADKSGSFGGASLPVPTSLSAGTFLVQAHERGSQQVAQAVGTIAGGTPQVKLSAQGAQPGEMIVFSLHGFSPGEAINIYWNSMGGQPVATVHADGAGAVSQASVQVPFGAVGPNTFLFVGSTSQALTAATIQLLARAPTVTLSSYAIQADNTLSFTGKGVGPGERVLVYLNNPNDAPVAVLQTNAQGAFSKAGNFLIPFSLKGKQTLVFQGEQSQTPSLVSCTVEPYTPGIQPSTYGGFPGTTVSFYATGFARNEVVHVYVGATQNRAGTLVSCFRTDAPGNAGAGGSYVIPGTAQVGKLVFKLIGSKSGGVGTATMQVAAAPTPVQVPAQPPFTCPLDTPPSASPSSGS